MARLRVVRARAGALAAAPEHAPAGGAARPERRLREEPELHAQAQHRHGECERDEPGRKLTVHPARVYPTGRDDKRDRARGAGYGGWAWTAISRVWSCRPTSSRSWSRASARAASTSP